MNIQNIILGLLQERPKTGYELKQEFDTSLGFFSGASFGSIYPILKRLEQQGLVRMKIQVQDGKPNRKIYSVTAKGRKAFAEALGETLSITPYRNDLLKRLFFFSHLTPDQRMKIVSEYLEYLNGKAELLASLEPLVREKADPYQLMCYRFGVRHTQNTIENTKQLKAELERHEKRAGGNGASRRKGVKR